MAKWGEIKCTNCAALEERLEARIEELEAELAQQDLVQAAVAAALREAAADIRQWGSLFCGSEDVTDEVANDILALIPEDAQAALDRVVAAEREECVGAVRAFFGNLYDEDEWTMEELVAAIREGGE